MSVQNLYAVWHHATLREREDGLTYYQRSHELIVSRVAHFHVRDVEVAKRASGVQVIPAAARVCGAFAALSPNNDELGNYRDLDVVCDAVLRRLQYEDFSVSSYGPNKLKAWLILRYGVHPVKVLGGLKVRSFYSNLLDPNDGKTVTIDGHCFNIWNGKRLPLRRKPNTKAPDAETDYSVVAAGYRAVAKSVGVLPCQLQATVWQTWKRMHRILYSPQAPLWNLYEVVERRV